MTTKFIDFFNKFLNKEIKDSIEPIDINLEGEWYMKKHIADCFKNYVNTSYVSQQSIGRDMNSYFRSNSHSVFYDKQEIAIKGAVYVKFLSKGIIKQTNAQSPNPLLTIKKNILSKSYQIESITRIQTICNPANMDFGKFNKEQIFIISDIIKQVLNDSEENN
jgi:hypothetical protein